MQNKKKYIILTIVILVVVFLVAFMCVKLKNNKVVSSSAEVTNVQVTETTEEEIPDGSSEINEDSLEAEGFEEYNEELAGTTNYTDTNSEELIAASSQKVYYSQVDSRWKNHPYTSTRK